MLCILYVTTIGFLLGLVGLLVERMLPPAAPRRWLWCAIIPVSLFLPGYYRIHHAMPVAELPDPAAHADALRQTWTTAAGLDFWARVESWNGMINLLWHIASAALILWGLAGAWRVWRIRRGAHAGSTVDGIDVLVTPSTGPATVGLLRSRVVVPRWVLGLPALQRGYVVRHEDEHRRAHDAALLFLASLTLVLAPWNLALWWQLRRLHLAVELDCDTRVVEALGDATAYGETLLAIAQAATRGRRLQPALLGVGSLERRLVALVAPAPLRRHERWLAPVLVAAILLVVLALPHPIIEHAAHTLPR
jgi:hypothetical protein